MLTRALTYGKFVALIPLRLTKIIDDLIGEDRIDNFILRRTVSLIAAALMIWLVVFKMVPMTATFMYDAFAFNVLKKEATMVFSKAEEIENRPGYFRVFACEKTPCQAQIDSIEFHIRDSFYMDTVWMFTKFQPYDPAELAGAFLAQKNHCTIEYYGKRRKYFGTYPKVINAECEQ